LCPLLLESLECAGVLLVCRCACAHVLVFLIGVSCLPVPGRRMSLLTGIKTRLGLVGVSTNATSRGVARERLSIILAHQRGDVLLEGIDLKALQAEVYECVKKYISVDASKPIQLSVKQDGAVDVFEMQVHLAGESSQRKRDVKP
ncbi:unnamed protein product, partial [Ectocarpus sp. 8 AP-2014]